MGTSLPPDDESSPTPPTPAAIAATQDPVPLRVALVQDERIPDGMVCMGSFIGDRLIARCVMPPEAWAQLQEHQVFEEPVPVVLVAREAPPGLQCQLYAMIVLPVDAEIDEDEEEDEEPWAASVPGAGYEAAADEADDEDDEDEEEEDEDGIDAQVAPIPLGNIVRYERDRVHPDSLPLEAADVLRKVIEGRTSEVVDRALAELLGM